MTELKKFIDKNLQYPKTNACVSGKVYIQFVVEKDGKITHPEIVNVDFDLEKYLANQQNFLNFWINQNELNLGKISSQNNQNWQINSQNNSVNNLNLEKNLENLQHNSLILDSNWSEKITGIGEIGLDYFYTKDQNLIKIQQKLFESQINLSINWQSKLTNLGKNLELNQEIEKINSQSLELKKLTIRNLEIQDQKSQQNLVNLPKFNSRNNSQTVSKNFENNEKSNSKNLPIVIHCREAFADLVSILTNFPDVHNNFLVHCWTGNTEELRQILDLGGIVAFGGILTYKSAEDLRIAARFCPLDRLTLETDLPFLSPQINRGKVCLPEFIDETCEKLAQIKNVEKSVIWQKSLENTRKLFQF